MKIGGVQDKEPGTKQMQISIDSAKRSYDMDLAEEINRLKINLNIDQNKYPAFWSGIRKNFSRKRINKDLICPMNCLYNLKIQRYMPKNNTLPISIFFKKYDLPENDKRRKSRKMEDMIQKYSFDVYKYSTYDHDEDSASILLLRDDFDKLIDDLRQTSFSNNYVGFMSWLIDRAFSMTGAVKGQKRFSNSRLDKNRSTLLKVLYELNPKALLKCFSANQ